MISKARPNVTTKMKSTTVTQIAAKMNKVIIRLVILTINFTREQVSVRPMKKSNLLLPHRKWKIAKGRIGIGSVTTNNKQTKKQ
mmetsp:Transcript_14328/g.24448  ORF Transcript_14328/g.24448 Transcript_14328/m.24448 type:complete len:84 (-) Transcript_14328:48-299(-)